MNRKLRIGVLDLVTNKGRANLFGRVMFGNLAGIMPQVVAVWCEEAGHQVTFICFTGQENLFNEIPDDLDLLIISAFTQSALLAYAVSNWTRQRGTITALGGPHARSYPDDAVGHFDYVLGLTTRDTISDVLADCGEHRPLGIVHRAERQPRRLPSVRERWPFIRSNLAKAHGITAVPILGSLGCPYSCRFCVDATVDFQQLDLEQLHDDLRFIRSQLERPFVAWYDPNFGVRFDDTMAAIEDAVPPGSVHFMAESSLSLLKEPRLQRLQRNGFAALLPGIDSWTTDGGKSGTGRLDPEAKLVRVAEHVNAILRHIPYVQANFVLGLDEDHGALPYELTKRFIDLVPGAFPGYSLRTAFGMSSPENADLHNEGRVLPLPFHLQDNNAAMNVRPKHIEWTELYDLIVGVVSHSFSARAIARRFAATPRRTAKWMNLLRAVDGEGRGRLKYHRRLGRLMRSDPTMRAYLEGESRRLPDIFRAKIQHDLGRYWHWLPEGQLDALQRPADDP